MTDENGQKEDGGIVDPELKEELQDIPAEDPFVTEYATPGGESGEKIGFVEGWFPDADEWAGKTNITKEQARALTLTKHLPKAFEEIEELEPFLNAIVEDYEMHLTSVEGNAREQQTAILRSMFGAGSGDEEDARNAIMTAFAAQNNEEDD